MLPFFEPQKANLNLNHGRNRCSPLIFPNALMSALIFAEALMNAICPPVALIRALRKIRIAASLMCS